MNAIPANATTKHHKVTFNGDKRGAAAAAGAATPSVTTIGFISCSSNGAILAVIIWRSRCAGDFSSTQTPVAKYSYDNNILKDP